MKKIVFAMCLAASAVGIDAQNSSVVFESESGKKGIDWKVVSESSVTYVTPTTDILANNYPGIDDKVITYTVTFPAAGTYDLYARVNVENGGAADDSFFFGNGFGEKSINSDSNWVICNGLSNVGYSDKDLDRTVDNGGTRASNSWKWVNITAASYRKVNFKVKEDKLTQMFEIGARENGLSLDKFAFVLSGKSITVAELNKIEPQK